MEKELRWKMALGKKRPEVMFEIQDCMLLDMAPVDYV